MNNYLSVFNVDVEKNDDIITVTYYQKEYVGTCNYRRVTTKGLKKPIQQNFYVMETVNMDGVYEYLNLNGGLTEKDYEPIRMEIREHSLNMVKKHFPLN